VHAAAASPAERDLPPPTGYPPRGVENLVRSIIAVLAIANPLGAVPLFLSLTEQSELPERRRAAVQAALAVFLILACAALGGRVILAVFGISIPAFRAAGGLVILLMGLEMLRGSPTRVQHERAPESDDAIVVPLAMPLIAGPGAITTVITLTTQAPGWRGQLHAFVAVAVTSGVLLVTLLSSAWIGRRITARGQRIFLRFMGLILVSIGAQLLLTGVQTFLPPSG
jgi:multiple antibiotic resistance protein